MMPAIVEVRATEVLRPTGYRILVRIPHLDAKMKSGLYRPDSSRSLEETASVLGEVLAIGETAYKDVEKFPGGPWCQVGDTVVMRTYSGTRIKVDGVEHRLINDDTVEAVVSDPGRIERA
jgi:co-chaperonin GroES (HSP10)